MMSSKRMIEFGYCVCLEVGIAGFHRVFTGVVLSRIGFGEQWE